MKTYRIVSIKGKKYAIQHSTSKNKKYMVKIGNNTIHFAARGYRMFPGQKRGQSYCARSFGIKGVNNINSANFWSRLLWKCKGKRSE